MNEQAIYVTKPFLPPLEEFHPYLEEIWKNSILTNGGPFHQELEKKLAAYLGVKYISLFSNGTIALITALQALEIKGEVITTPFSFVATAHALLWNGITPVFADIEPVSFTLDPQAVEKAITEKTRAILPVHVYGYPCKTKELESIARKYGLKIIYDAAHTFGASLNGTSLCSYGDLSVLSFHATKVFNTFEGGAIVSHTPEMKEHIDHLKNFGFTGETTVVEAGINGKMNELQAAFGLLQLQYLDQAIHNRDILDKIYREKLADHSSLLLPDPIPGLSSNHAYFPVRIKGNKRDVVYEYLKKKNVHTRRYFYPLISRFPMYLSLPSSAHENLPVASTIAEEVLCLPIYPELEPSDCKRISQYIMESLSQ